MLRPRSPSCNSTRLETLIYLDRLLYELPRDLGLIHVSISGFPPTDFCIPSPSCVRLIGTSGDPPVPMSGLPCSVNSVVTWMVYDLSKIELPFRIGDEVVEGKICPWTGLLKTEGLGLGPAGRLAGVGAGKQPAAMNDSRSQLGWRVRGMRLHGETHSPLSSVLSSTSLGTGTVTF